jgi:hypothetical protein
MLSWRWHSLDAPSFVMPPRRSARLAAASEAALCAQAPLAPLLLPLVQRIFSSIPAVDRARACCVSRGWRDVLADPALWRCLNLQLYSLGRLDAAALLRGAAARARGSLHTLNVSGPHCFPPHAVMEVVTANAGSLRELRVSALRVDVLGAAETDDLIAAVLLRAEPLLQVLGGDFSLEVQNATRLMRAEPPYARPLQPRVLKVRFDDRQLFPNQAIGNPGGMERVGPFAAVLQDATLQPSLVALKVFGADTANPAVLDALVDAALARRLQGISFEWSTPPAPAPLARLVAGGALELLELRIVAVPNHNNVNAQLPDIVPPLFDAAGAALVAAALRNSTTLRTLSFFLTGCDDDATTVLFGALVGHRSLRSLSVTIWRYGDQVMAQTALAQDAAHALGAALGAIVAADSPTLMMLILSRLHLGDTGLAHVVDALPRNRHLRMLTSQGNDMSEEFARERLLPALRANVGLRLLNCIGEHTGAAAAEAVELMNGRPPLQAHELPPLLEIDTTEM